MSTPAPGLDGVLRVAMWSGPRNISTAMMRSFGARADTLVVDEPLYAHYLAVTGLDHPARDAVLASQPQRWQDVAAALTGPLPDGIRVYYQKHMAHHLVDEIDDRTWVLGLTNVLLIRDPAEVVASYTRARSQVAPEDIGLLQQVRLHEELSAAGAPPLVVDAADFLDDPEVFLRELCRRAGVDFTDRMLRARGREETLILGSDTLKPMIRELLPEAEIVSRPRFSTLRYAGSTKLSRLPPRSAIVAFSAEQVYAVAEMLRRMRGGAAVVMGALSPRTRNAQVAMYQAIETI